MNKAKTLKHIEDLEAKGSALLQIAADLRKSCGIDTPVKKAKVDSGMIRMNSYFKNAKFNKVK